MKPQDHVMTISLYVRHRGGGMSYFLLEPESKYDFKKHPWIKKVFMESVSILKEMLNDRKHDR